MKNTQIHISESVIDPLEESNVSQPSIVPDLALRLAVVERALCDASGNIQAAKYSVLKIQRDAINWVKSDSLEPLSFLDCCASLNANTAGLRNLLEHALATNTKIHPISYSKTRTLRLCCRLDDPGMLIQYVERK